jgi:hypothetical protein
MTYFCTFDLLGEKPLLEGREAGTAAAPEPRFLEFGDDVVTGHLGQDLFEGGVAVTGDVLFDVLGVDEAAVAENDAKLLLIEADIVDLRVLLGLIILVEEAINRSSLHDVLGNELLRVFRLDLDVERLVGKDFYDRTLFAEPEAPGLHNLDVVLGSRPIEFVEDVVVDVVSLARLTTGAATDQDVLVVRHINLPAFRRRGCPPPADRRCAR